MRAIGCNGELPFTWWSSGWAWSFPSLDSDHVRNWTPHLACCCHPETFGTVTDRVVGWRETRTERKDLNDLKTLDYWGISQECSAVPFYWQHAFEWLYPILFIHSLAGEHLSCFYFLSVMNSAVVNTCAQVFCMDMFSFLYVHLGVELLVTHMVTLCLNFWRIARLFSIWVAPFYIPTSCLWGFQSLHILSDTCCSLSF